MFRHRDPEVLVVGAGPVGLTAALFLQQHGIRVEVVDMHQRTTQHSYALAIHPRTLRVLDEAGLSAGLITAGRKLTTVAYYEGRERRAAIDYSALLSSIRISWSSDRVCWREPRRMRSARSKLKVLWGHRLQSLDTADATPRAEVANSTRSRPATRSRERVARRAKRDDPSGLCHRRRRVRLGGAADVRHRDGPSMARARSSPFTRSRRRGTFLRRCGSFSIPT